jgi:hypothetical protein
VPGLVLTDRRLLLENRDPLAGAAHQELARRRQADDAAADDHDVVPLLGHRPLPSVLEEEWYRSSERQAASSDSVAGGASGTPLR